MKNIKHIHYLKENSLKHKKVIIGYFDVIHLGHTKLFDDSEAVILTFDNVPKKKCPINSLPNRIKNLHQLGFKKIFVFDVVKNNMTAKEFYDIYLKDALSITAGSDCKIGSDQVLIKKIVKTNQLHIVKNDKKCTTTKIKQALSEGKIELANKMLYFPFFICHKVDHGNKNARKIGFPTINFNLGNDFILKEGVYATLTYYKGVCYHSVSFWGVPKTVGLVRNLKVFETHIINNFNKTIYGKSVKVELIKRIADIKKFNNIDELRNAIAKYIQQREK